VPGAHPKLWPKTIVRQIRFHDLRHTTASLSMMAGADPAAVQRILHHRDPRITTEVYGHLAPDYLRAEFDRLRFFTDQPPRRSPEPEPARAVAGTKGDPFAAPVLQGSPEAENGLRDEDAKSPKLQRDLIARHRRFELLTYGSGGRRSIQLS
jgi:integrase